MLGGLPRKGPVAGGGKATRDGATARSSVSLTLWIHAVHMILDNLDHIIGVHPSVQIDVHRGRHQVLHTTTRWVPVPGEVLDEGILLGPETVISGSQFQGCGLADSVGIPGQQTQQIVCAGEKPTKQR